MPPNKPSKMSKAKSEDAAEGPPKEEEEQSQFMSIFWGVFKTVALLTLLYFFICSITFLEDAFKLVSGQNAGTLWFQLEDTVLLIGTLLLFDPVFPKI